MTNRVRSRALAPSYDCVKVKNYNTNVTVTRPSYVLNTKVESMTDVVTPDFHSRIENGEVINNPLSYTVESRSILPSECYYQQVYTPDPWNGTYTMIQGSNTARQLLQECSFTDYDNDTLGVFSFDAIAQAKTRALANVDSTPYEFMEDLAEIREVINFLQNPLAALSNLASAFRRKHDHAMNIKDMPSRLRALADLWNSYRFAMAPLVRSVMTLAEALADKEITRPVRRNAHGYSTDSIGAVTTTHAPWTGGVGTQIVYTYSKTQTKSRQVHAAVLYEVKNPLVDIFYKLGLRLKDIPVVAWELVPLSFMVDRLWDIKNLISAFLNLADPDVTILSGSTTDRITSKRSVSNVGKYSPYGIYTYTITKPDIIEFSTFTMSRTLWTVGITDIVPPLTGWSLVSDISRILDLIALTISRLPR